MPEYRKFLRSWIITMAALIGTVGTIGALAGAGGSVYLKAGAGAIFASAVVLPMVWFMERD